MSRRPIGQQTYGVATDLLERGTTDRSKRPGRVLNPERVAALLKKGDELCEAQEKRVARMYPKRGF